MFKSMPKTASWSSASSQNRLGDFPRACFFVRKTPVSVGEMQENMISRSISWAMYFPGNIFPEVFPTGLAKIAKNFVLLL